MLLNSRWTFLVISAILYVTISYFTERSDSVLLLSQISILYLALLMLWKRIKNLEEYSALRFIAWSAICLRILLLFSFPNLSDDIYRFLWDGYMTNGNINPYLIMPENFGELNSLNEQSHVLLENMNSRNYFTVYPPLDQLLFATSVFLGHSIESQTFLLKLILLLSELIGIYYLPKLLVNLNHDSRLSLFYLLNPLVILEGVGNLHFEVFSASMLIAFFYFITKRNMLKVSLSFALGAGIKLLPLIFLPAIYRSLGLKKAATLILAFILINGLFFLPFLDIEVFRNFFSSIDLYFHSFEFNASIYYLIRAIGYFIVDYNIISTSGTILAISSFILIIAMAFKAKTNDVMSLLYSLFASVLVYYMLSTTVHPWYLINLLFLAICVGFHRSVVLWSYLIFFSYTTYSSTIYNENLWIVASCYILIYVALYYDFKQWKMKKAIEKQN